MADGLVARLHTDVEALLAVAVIRLGQDVVDVVEHVALVQELVVRLLELQAPAPGDGGEGRDVSPSCITKPLRCTLLCGPTQHPQGFAVVLR